MVDFNLEGKIAVITGASRGIGESIAMTLAKYGAQTILVSRKIDALEEVAKKIEDQGGKAHPIACNMGNMDQIDALYKEVQEKFGKLDILINNAATNPYFGEMADAPESAWDKTFDVNLKGPFFMIQKAIPFMEKSGGGSIVNVSSVNSIRPAMMQGMYSMTKAAMNSMTKAYAKELAGKKIRVNALLPGFTETKFSSALSADKEIYENAIRDIPLHRSADPSEMAGAVLYLVSEASSFTTGITLIVDGGQLA